MAGPSFSLRFESDEQRNKAVEKAAAKGISLNEWVNRTVNFGLTNGGKLKITTTVEAEF